MKKFLFTLLAALLTLPAALAQSWSGQYVYPDNYQGSGHVVYIKLVDENWSSGQAQTLNLSDYKVVAYVGNELRSYVKVTDPTGLTTYSPEVVAKSPSASVSPAQDVHYFPVRIAGDDTDNGKTITFRLWDVGKSLEYVLPLNLTYSDGATASYPSQATAVDFTPVQSYSYPESFYINKGETREFPITYVPANASHPIIAINTQFENISIDGFNVTGNEYGYFDLYLANGQGYVNGFVVNPIESVTITDPEKLYVGELRELQLNIVGKDHNDTEYVYCDINVVYNNPTIVDDYGKGLYYNALSRGTATATVTVTGKTSTTPIILTAHFNVLQPITDITVPETAQTLWSHKSYNVNQFITVTPDVVDEKVAYGVPDSYSDVIGVDADGNIEIKGTGRAQINVWPEDHERPLKTIDFEIKKAATDFSVKDNPIYMIKDTRKAINECITLTPEGYDKNTQPRFTIQSSDKTVVNVAEGVPVINAVGLGSATITINMAYTNVSGLEDVKASHTMQVIVTEELLGFTIVEADAQSTVWASNLVENEYTLKPDPEGARFDLANISLWADCEWHVYQEAGVTKISLTPSRIGSSSFDVLYDNGTEAGLTSTFYLNVGQKYNLNTGWSWTTSPYMYVDVKAQSGKGKLYDIFDGGLDEMRSFSSMVIWDPGWNMYVGDIDDYTFDHYKVKMKEAKEITVFGTVKNEKTDVQIYLEREWTWFVNLFQNEIDINSAWAIWKKKGGYLNNGAIIKGKESYATYNASTDEFSPSTFVLAPGEGYLLTPNDEYAPYYITYPMASEIKYPEMSSKSNNAPAKKYWEYDHSHFLNNMALTAQIVDLPNAENFTVGAFVGNECRGEAVYEIDRWFTTVHGEGGDVVTLKLMDKFSGEIYDLEGSWSFTQSLGSIKEPVVIASPVIETDGIITPIASSGISVDGSSIVGEGIEIYDLQGRNVTESNGQLTNGVYIVRSQGKALKVTVK